MKFMICIDEFKKAMETAYKVINKNSSSPVLQNIKLHIDGEKSYMLGTDLENFVKTNLKISGTDEIKDIIFSDTTSIFKAMKFFKGTNVSFTVENKKVIMSSGGKQTVQELLNENEAIEIPRIKNIDTSKKYQYNINSLKERFNFVKYAADSSKLNPILNGIHFNSKDMVTTDSCRLALNKSDELNVETAFTVSTNSIDLVIDVLEGDITLITDDNYIEMSNEKTTVISRLLSGTYINYKSFISVEGEEFTANISEYKDTLKYFRAFKKTGKRRETQSIAWLNDTLILCGSENSSRIENTSGKFAAPIGFNNKYMLDALTQFQSDEIVFRIKNSLSPIILENGGDNLAFVFPMRLKDEQLNRLIESITHD